MVGTTEPRLVKILLVDDDPKFCSYVSQGLRDSGMRCETALQPRAAAEKLRAEKSSTGQPFDMILLDVMMPESSGWDFLGELRASGNETPVIFVTARDAVDERVRGLELGADDYIIKPFAFQELLARIQAVVRRREAVPTLRAGDLTMDLGARRVQRGDRRVELSPKEFDLLRCLLEARGRVLSRSELLSAVWGIEFDPGTNVVDVHVARLRRRLDAPGSTLIETVVGEGYRAASFEETTT